MISWDQVDVPRGVAAVLGRLQGHAPEPLDDAAWEEALAFTDRFQLTLLLRGPMPAWVAERIARDRQRNQARQGRLMNTFRKVRAALDGVPFAVLKGFANWELFPVAAEDRMQYDLDLYCPERVGEVRDRLVGLGYEAIEGPLTLVRRSEWKWNGDFYDPEIPVAVDLHEALWDEGMERFGAPGLESFWERRVERSVAGMKFEGLAPEDALAFGALHALRHLLHGDARPAQMYEIGGFLAARAGDDAFWEEWRRLHPERLRRIEAIVFRLAGEWFGGAVHGIVSEEIALLPARVQRWFERFAASPVTAFFAPNKDELALNLCLIEGVGAKARVAGRRLLPARWPHPFSYAVERGLFHLRALGPAVSVMLRVRR